MSKIVEECAGDGRSNPLLNYVHRYTDDKSAWQDQFLHDDERQRQQGPPPALLHGGYFGGPIYGPPPPEMIEKKMVDEFLNPSGYGRFQHFDISEGGPQGPMGPPPPPEFVPPSRLPPQLFNEFIHAHGREDLIPEAAPFEGQIAPQDASKIRNRSQIMSRHFNPEVDASQDPTGTLLSNLNINEGPLQSTTKWQEESIHGRHGDWIKDYGNATQNERNFEDFEKSWEKVRSTTSITTRSEPRTWTEQFHGATEEQQDFEKVYNDIEDKNQSKQWAESYVEEEQQQKEKEKENTRWKEMAHQVSQIDDPKLQNSQFMQFINKMASGELDIKDGQLVPVSGGHKLANEFLQSGETWADQFEGSWADQFSSEWGQFGTNWGQEFERGDWEERDLINKYNDVWDKIQDREKQNQTYQFQQDNPYLNDPEALQKGISLFDQGNLPGAILALEAAVQQSPDNTQAWAKLGMAHAENDKDSLAILALEQALKVDPYNLDALLALAVSHTNEFHQAKAVQCLRDWLQRNPAYRHMFPTNDNQYPVELRQVEEMYIMAAKERSTMDPQLHSALGLIYNLSFEYDKAIDCFRAALIERPDDYQLWNKLGATTANSTHGRDRAPEAIDAYFRALQKKPTYTRARANLGISYMAIQNYTEAAKCFLGALEINNTSHLWENLKSAFTMMERPDLIQRMHENRDVNAFREEFDF